MKPRRWFYQNWFILMFVGGIFAFAAWALIEPVLDDHISIQGPITKVNPFSLFGPTWTEDNKPMHLNVATRGSIEVAGHKVWLLEYTKMWVNGAAHPLTMNDVNVGKEVRVI